MTTTMNPCALALADPVLTWGLEAVFAPAFETLQSMGFEVAERRTTRLTEMSSARFLVADALFLTESAVRLELRARLLATDMPATWGRTFVHVELEREAPDVGLLPDPKRMFAHLQLATADAIRSPQEDRTAELTEWYSQALSRAVEAFDAVAFRATVEDALAH